MLSIPQLGEAVGCRHRRAVIGDPQSALASEMRTRPGAAFGAPGRTVP
jgi:hypothetical protein